MTAHSTCMLRNRSPFFTPPCSILAPRLVPVIPSLQRQNRIKQNDLYKLCFRGFHPCIVIFPNDNNNNNSSSISRRRSSNRNRIKNIYLNINIQHTLNICSKHGSAYMGLNFLLFESGASDPSACLCNKGVQILEITYIQYLIKVMT